MPSPDQILSGVTALANEWRWLAIIWHLLLLALSTGIAVGWRPSARLLGRLLVVPLGSVGVLAFVSGNPFNGIVFIGLAGALFRTAARLENARVRFASFLWVAAGGVFVAFGWTYPHFVHAGSWTEFLYAAPFALVPCPTLALLIGTMLLFPDVQSRSWNSALTAAGLFYGIVGVLVLRVQLDYVLLGAATMLAANTVHRGRLWRSVHGSHEEHTRVLPGDSLISEPLASLTNAITIARHPYEVWPWLVQMGAGTRAGWYSYDALDNGRQPSAVRIVPELQQIAIGTVFPALPGVTEGFTVLAFEPSRSLVLGWPDLEGKPLVTWAFFLEDRAGEATRLIVRVRGAEAYRFHGLPRWLSSLAARFVHYVMQRKQLLGIAERAEAADVTMSLLASTIDAARRSA